MRKSYETDWGTVMISASSSNKSDNASTFSSSMNVSWISWYTSLRGNDLFTEVPDDFIADRFNLIGLENSVANYYHGIDMLRDEFDNEYGVGALPSEPDVSSATQLYGLIHARYILSQRGVEDMAAKYQRGDFGKCPRVYCNGQHVLPMGLSDTLGDSAVKLYCARCQNVFHAARKYKHLDGAFFGVSFPQMFFMTLPVLRPKLSDKVYEPRLYGFKLDPMAYHPIVSSLPDSSLSR